MKLYCALTFTLLLFCNVMMAQRGSIQGTVSGDGVPLEFANVGITELGLGSSTDAAGKYVIQDIPFGTYQLSVSFVGFETYTQSVTINSTATTLVDVSMGAGSATLD